MNPLHENFLRTPLLDTNKHSNIVEYVNWVLSELSVGVNKMVNRIGRKSWVVEPSQVHVKNYRNFRGLNWQL